MTYKIAFYITTCVLIILCIIGWNKLSVTSLELKPPLSAIKLADKLWKNSATITSGVNVVSGETVVVNTLTGEELEPCETASFTGTFEKNYPDIKQNVINNNKAENLNCNVKVVNIDPNLRAAIVASNTITTGTVIKNGKKVSAKFVVHVTAIYEGSICSTYFNAGNQYTICLDESNFCLQMYQNIFAATKWWAENVGPPMTDEEIQQSVLENLPSYCTGIVNTN